MKSTDFSICSIETHRVGAITKLKGCVLALLVTVGVVAIFTAKAFGEPQKVEVRVGVILPLSGSTSM